MKTFNNYFVIYFEMGDQTSIGADSVCLVQRARAQS